MSNVCRRPGAPNTFGPEIRFFTRKIRQGAYRLASQLSSKRALS